MLIILSILVIILIGCLIMWHLIEAKLQVQAERNTSACKMYSKHISYLEDVIMRLHGVPSSSIITRLLLERVLYFTEKRLNLFPQKLECREHKQNTLIRIEQSKKMSYLNPLPKFVNENTITATVKTVKAVIRLLGLEAYRQPERSRLIQYEVEDLKFLISYMYSLYYIQLGNRAYESKTFGSARSSYESALKFLNLSNPTTANSERVKEKTRLCSERITLIDDEIRESNQQDVLSRNVSTPDETGLSRMMEDDRPKLIF